MRHCEISFFGFFLLVAFQYGTGQSIKKIEAGSGHELGLNWDLFWSSLIKDNVLIKFRFLKYVVLYHTVHTVQRMCDGTYRMGL